MKKWLLITASIVFLAACSAQGEKDSAQPVEQNTPAEEPAADQTGMEEEQTESEDLVDTAESEDRADAGQEQASETDLPEYALVEEKAGEKNLNSRVESDNPGNRIVLYEDLQGTEKFKSIYIKKENRLKIIDLENDKLIYNEVVNL